MSFVKKAVKKTWGFVKKHWKEIAIVAAIVFTAGALSPLGFAAFAGVNTVGGFMGAVGTTMWAGTGQIATLGAMQSAGSIAAQGAASAAAAQAAATGAAVAAGTAGNATVVGTTGLGTGVGTTGGAMMPGMTANSASVLAGTAAPGAAGTTGQMAASGAIQGTAGAGGSSIAPAAAKEAAKKAGEEVVKKEVQTGLSDAAWKTLGVVAPIAGAGLMALGEDDKYPNTEYWAVNNKTGEGMPGGAATQGRLAAGDQAGPDAGAATAMIDEQMNRSKMQVMAPLMGNDAEGER